MIGIERIGDSMKVLDAFRRGTMKHLHMAYDGVSNKAYEVYEKAMTTVLKHSLSILPLYVTLKISYQVIKETAYEQMRTLYMFMKRENN